MWPGSLNNTNSMGGFFAFTRLIGTCYFKMHLTAFAATKGHSTPFHLYNSLEPSLPVKEKHRLWLHQIREVINDRIINEEDRVPTFTVLQTLDEGQPIVATLLLSRYLLDTTSSRGEWMDTST